MPAVLGMAMLKRLSNIITVQIVTKYFSLGANYNSF